jgi:patatin-related protein
MTRDDGKTHTRELRFALVCYGGVSLAIYMHGITKELHKLVRASRKFDESWPTRAGANPFQSGNGADSEYAYFEQLRDLAESGTPITVTVDIIAGTSAGGINGVCLAKVLAHNGQQETLKSLWIDEGDLKQLVQAPRVGGWRTRALLRGIRIAMSPTAPRFPLRGDRMSRLLFDAISGMEGSADESLVPPAGSLDLFVTTTDLHGFDVLVPTGAGGMTQRDADHAQALRFRYETGVADDFTVADTGSLAFAARATSCFPGAFPPVSLASFEAELRSDGRPRELHADRLAPQFRRAYSESGNSLDEAWFIDGGVLDNAPYDLVVDAIADKRAETEVIRRLVYIQPDPGLPLRIIPPKANKPSGTEAPGWLPSLWTTLTSVKGSHPVLRDLLRLRDLNLRIQEVGAIASAQMDQVLAILDSADPVAAATGDTPVTQDGQTSWDELTFDAVGELASVLHVAATKLIGASYPTYCRLKLEAAGRALADETARQFAYPPDSSHRSFLRAVLSAWGQRQPAWRAADLKAIGELLGPADIPYRTRRLLFILAGINGLYQRARSGRGGGGTPTANHLDELKAKAWDLLETVRHAPRDAVHNVDPGLRSFLSAAQLGTRAVFTNPRHFAAEHETELTALFSAYSTELGQILTDSSKPMWQEFKRITHDWSPSYRRSLLSRYVGFPLWDALIFPTIALSHLPQFTPIRVSQFSPVAANALTAPNGAKLKGTGWHHFGGFMDPEWRENDYLWGRLDGAELILRTLRASVDETVPEATTAGRLSPEEATQSAGPHLQQALSRILDAEANLHRLTTLRGNLDTQIKAMGSHT